MIVPQYPPRLSCGSRVLDLAQPQVMGILNVTPDSFFDGGRYLTLAAAIDHAARLVAEGADYLDVGGESTRPGAQAVSADEECARVIPVLDNRSRRFRYNCTAPGRDGRFHWYSIPFTNPAISE